MTGNEHDRQVLAACYVAFTVFTLVEKGQVDGIEFPEGEIQRIAEIILAAHYAGIPRPTDAEFSEMVDRFREKYPEVATTSLGLARMAYGDDRIVGEG